MQSPFLLSSLLLAAAAAQVTPASIQTVSSISTCCRKGAARPRWSTAGWSGSTAARTSSSGSSSAALASLCPAPVSSSADGGCGAPDYPSVLVNNFLDLWTERWAVRSTPHLPVCCSERVRGEAVGPPGEREEVQGAGQQGGVLHLPLQQGKHWNPTLKSVFSI